MNSKLSKVTAGLLLGAMITYTLPVAAFTKDETVYSNMKSNGEEYNTIVTTHLINEEDEEILNDLSNLLNIENTSGEEKFEQNGESLIWDANKNDIYYKGETEKELPIGINVKYELDGKEILPSEIAGKSGKVKITIEVINKEKQNVTINGKEEQMYTPFIVATGTYIDNENNKNIEVKNGKIIDDGSKTMIIGITLPGMQESLKIEKETIEIPTTIEITMDSTNFEMKNIINYATPKIIEETEIDIFGKLDEIYNKVATLQTASKKIEQGATELAEGTKTYEEKSQEFNNAISEFSKGVNTANNSYRALDKGINTLNNSIPTLTSGSKQISDGLSQVNSGVKIIAESLSASGEKITQLQVGAENIANGLSTLNSNLVVEDNTDKVNQITSQITANNNKINELIGSTSKLSEVINDETIPEEIKEAIYNQIKINNETISRLKYNNSYLQETIESLKTSEVTIQTIKSNLTNLENGSKQVSQGINILTENVSQLNSGLTNLYTSTGKLSEGANNLYNGTMVLRSGSIELSVGSKQMKTGLNTIANSTKEIYNADNQLVEGAKTISQGATELAEGTKEFNETGINVICNYINKDIKNISIRAEKLKELSDKYNTFTKINDKENKGKVKFITIIDSIKKDDDNNSKEKIDEKTSK